jgi:hypothetical protein
MMKKIILILFIPFLFTACRKPCEDSHNNCTPEELSWLAYYDAETIIFKRNDGVLDTIQVSQRHFHDVELSHASQDGQVCAKFLQIASHSLMGKHIIANIQVFGDNFQSPLLTLDTNINFNLEVTLQNNIIINGVTYNNVYIPSTDTLHFAQLTYPKPWRAYYSKYSGLLRIDYTNGVFWEKIN